MKISYSFFAEKTCIGTLFEGTILKQIVLVLLFFFIAISLVLFSDLRLRDEIDGSHWLGQEHPDWVNTRITGFLALICH